VTVLRTLRSLVLGETWALPLGVAAAVGLALVVRAIAPEDFEDVGGFILLAGVVCVLAIAVRRSLR
jgi:hypothetical protein